MSERRRERLATEGQAGLREAQDGEPRGRGAPGNSFHQYRPAAIRGRFAKAARIKSIVGSIFAEKTVVGSCWQSRAFEIDRPIIGLMS